MLASAIASRRARPACPKDMTWTLEFKQKHYAVPAYLEDGDEHGNVYIFGTLKLQLSKAKTLSRVVASRQVQYLVKHSSKSRRASGSLDVQHCAVIDEPITLEPGSYNFPIVFLEQYKISTDAYVKVNDQIGYIVFRSVHLNLVVDQQAYAIALSNNQPHYGNINKSDPGQYQVYGYPGRNMSESLPDFCHRVSDHHQLVGPYQLSAFAPQCSLGGAFQWSLDLYDVPSPCMVNLVEACIVQEWTWTDPRNSSTPPVRGTQKLQIATYRPKQDLVQPGQALTIGQATCRLPGHHVLTPSTASTTRTPLSVSHKLVILVYFFYPNTNDIVQIKSEKAVHLASCARLFEHFQLPAYSKDSVVVEIDEYSRGCVCDISTHERLANQEEYAYGCQVLTPFALEKAGFGITRSDRTA